MSSLAKVGSRRASLRKTSVWLCDSDRPSCPRRFQQSRDGSHVRPAVVERNAWILLEQDRICHILHFTDIQFLAFDSDGFGLFAAGQIDFFVCLRLEGFGDI